MHKPFSKTAQAVGLLSLMVLLGLGGCDDHKPAGGSTSQASTAMVPAQQAVPVMQAQSAHVPHSHLAHVSGAQPDTDGTSDALQTAFDDTRSGAISYNPPSSMKLKSTEIVTVRIFGNNLPHVDAPAMAGSGAPVTENTKVSDLMSVSLTGANFTIDPADGGQQLVPKDSFAEWIFHVTPTSGGQQTLVLQAKIFTGNNPTGLASITRAITVKVSPFQFMGIDLTNFWNWLWGALGAGVIAVVTSLVKRWWGGKQAKPSDDS